MASAGFYSLFAPWVGGSGTTVVFIPAPPPPPPPPEETVLLTRILRRLPPSLWDIDPASDTLQRDIALALAREGVRWLEEREIVRTMTLLREAQGTDLDVLLADYGLRRYLQRPDATARQVGMQLLWTPKETAYSVARLADLLFDLPHRVLRTGRGQQHVFIAATHAVTTPYGYWGLVSSSDGAWYAVTVDGLVPTISQNQPPGLDVSPGPHTLTWFTVRDELGATWYVSIHEDMLRLETAPPAGYGTTEPFVFRDGQGQSWGMAARSVDQVLLAVPPTAPPAPTLGYWRLRDPAGVVWALWVEAHVPTIATTAPTGSDRTPGGVPLEWFRVAAGGGDPWYVSVEHATLIAEHAAPAGSGTSEIAEFVDATGQRWAITVQEESATLMATALGALTDNLLVVEPGAPFQALELRDALGVAWWVSVQGGALTVTATLPLHATDVTPADGPFRWWRVYDLAGTRWAVSPSTLGVLVLSATAPGGRGTAQPQAFGDAQGTLWHVGVNAAGHLAVSDTPAIDYAGMATAICLTDPLGARWYWRAHGQVIEWSDVLWPDTVDQSPWGDLGWFQGLNTDGAVRYFSPTTVGSPIATIGPPPATPWGLPEAFTFLDLAGAPWHLTALLDDRVGVFPSVPVEDLPHPETRLDLREALEAFAHLQAAGSAITLLIT